MEIRDRLIGRLFGIATLRKLLVARYHRELAAFLASNRTIVFPPADRNPDLSIIIPVYNGAHHLLSCLQSLAQGASPRTEVIVYDDSSHDRVGELAGRCKNVTFIQGRQNLGFVGAVTAASAHTRGRHILLVNSDATLMAGNIDEGVRLLDEHPDWGMVGVRIKLATGKLQEAGCMIFNDGTTDGYLRGQPPDDPRAMFQREVDYASGAFLFIRGDAFRAAGGLNPAYAPAYYEETDLAMRLRERGLKCVYHPGILVEHFEFGSQPKVDARKAIGSRRQIFIDNWRHALETPEFGPPTEHLDRYSHRRMPAPRVLIVSPADGPADPGIVASARNTFGSVCLFLLDTSFSGSSRKAWHLDSGVKLEAGNLAQLKDHVSAMEPFYDAILTRDFKTLETLKTLGQLKVRELACLKL